MTFSPQNRLLILAMLLVWLASNAHAAEFRILDNGDIEAATTSTLLLLRHGSVATLGNIITGEKISNREGSLPSSILFQDGNSESPSTDTLSRSELSPGKAVQTTTLISGTSIQTTISGDPFGALLVQQTVKTSAPGVERLTLGLPSLTDDQTLLIPTGTGLQVDRTFTGNRSFEWPGDWRVQKTFLTTRKGGVLIEAKDPDFKHFKSLDIQGGATTDTLHMALSTQVPQPVAEVKQGNSAAWSFRAFDGSWQDAAEIERLRLLARVSSLHASRDQHREWVKKIRLIVTPFRMRESSSGPLSEARYRKFLSELAKKADPETTLINFAYDARNEELDTGPPGQEVNKNARKTIEYARSLGFKVMVSLDFRCDLRHPLYPEARRSHMRFGLPQLPPYGFEIPALGAEYVTFVQRPVWKVRGKIAETQLAAINPGNKGWRDLYLRQTVRVLRVFKAHAAHVAGITYVNDANGLVENMNSIQGYRQLLVELRKAVPAITALSIDAWDEVSLGYADIAQLQLPDQLGINPARPAEMMFDETWLNNLHPVSAQILRRDFPPYSPILISSGFSRASAAWEASTACLGPIAHAAAVDDKSIQNPPPALQARLAKAEFLRQFNGEIDPAGWAESNPSVRWSGEGQTLKVTWDQKEKTLTANTLDGDNEDLLYSVDLDGHYIVPGAATSPATSRSVE